MAYRDSSGGRRAPTNEPDWLTLGQAAKYLGVAQSTIRKWSDQGRLPAFYTPGGHRRYRRGDLDAFLERSGPGGRAKEGPLVLIVDDDADCDHEQDERPVQAGPSPGAARRAHGR